MPAHALAELDAIAGPAGKAHTDTLAGLHVVLDRSGPEEHRLAFGMRGDFPKRQIIERALRSLPPLPGQYRPLFYFGVPGALLLLAGIGAGFWVVQRFLELSQIASGTALLSLLACMFGLVMLSTGFTLHSVRGLLFDMLHHHLKDENHA